MLCAHVLANVHVHVPLQIFKSIQVTEPGEKVAVQLMAVNKVWSASHPCYICYILQCTWSPVRFCIV